MRLSWRRILSRSTRTRSSLSYAPDLIKEKRDHVETDGMRAAQQCAREEELKELGAAQRELIKEQEAHEQTKGELALY